MRYILKKYMNMTRAQVKQKSKLIQSSGVKAIVLDVIKEMDKMLIENTGIDTGTDNIQYAKLAVRMCHILESRYKKELDKVKEVKVQNYDLEQAIKDQKQGKY